MSWLTTKIAESIPLRSEEALVVHCSRTQAGPETRRKVTDLLKENLDWDYVFRFARRHSTLPLVYEQLKTIAPASVPAEHLKRFKTYFRENAARNLLLAGELCRLIKLLEADGLEVIPYKGPALAVCAYGNLALRRFVDLDIMVRKNDVLRAKDLLTAEGYACSTDWTMAQQTVLLRTQHNLPLSREEGRLIVELHWEVASDLFASSLQAEQLWDRLQPLVINNVAVKSLSTEDLLLSLCVHGSRHLWERLAWICDVAELLKAHRELNWSNVLERAEATGNLRMLLLGLYLANGFFEAPYPAEIASKVDGDQALASLAGDVSSRLFGSAQYPPVTARESFSYNMRIREGWRSRLRYWRLLLRPTDGDVATVSLPAKLSFAYYLVRPLRLLRSDRERRVAVQKSKHA